MHPMRRLIALNEAPKKISAIPVSQEERDRVEQAHRAQELAHAKAAVFQLKAKALQVAQQSQRSDYYGPWDQAWVGEVQALIKARVERAKAASKEEHDYQLEDNANAQPTPINRLECIVEGIGDWWDDKKDRLEWGEVKYNFERYMDAKPDVEQSDDMSRLRSEAEMLTHIQYLNGGFGSVAEMEATLTAISTQLDTTSQIQDNGWSSVGITSTDLIKKGIPVIILYCQLIEKIK